MFGLKTAAIALGIGVLIGALPTGYFMYQYTNNKWIASTEKLKNESLALLQQATEKARRVERENSKLASKIDVVHAKAEKQIHETLAENRRLVYSLGGMRDPGCREGGTDDVPGTSTASISSAGCAPGNKFSDQTTEFLLGFAEEADSAANYAKTCYEWIRSVGGKNLEKEGGVTQPPSETSEYDN